MAILNSQNADYLCTAITLGFIKRVIIDQTLTQLVYEKPDEAAEHQQVASLLNPYLGAEIRIVQAPPQSEMPFIAAKHRKIAKSEIPPITRDYKGIIDYLHSKANDGEPLRGAYIGGFINPNETKIKFIGPSKLDIRDPEYREISPAESVKIAEAYQRAIAATKGSIKCIETLKGTIIPQFSTKLALFQFDKTPEPEPIPSNKLFSSYHGMIRVLEKYGTTLNGNFAIELALGGATAKVGSCIPCSMFMEAADMPATATHLGRGDNWTCNKTNPQYTAQWKANIINDYKYGSDILKSKGLHLGEWGAFDAQISNLPEIFLDALTFEKSFTGRILSTLPK